MVAISVEELYQKYVKHLSSSERLRRGDHSPIYQQTVKRLCRLKQERPKRSLLELEGLGAEIREGVDAQEYVNQLRDEWDHRP